MENVVHAFHLPDAWGKDGRHAHDVMNDSVELAAVPSIAFRSFFGVSTTPALPCELAKNALVK